MKRLLGTGIGAILVVTLAVVIFTPTRPACYPGQTSSDVDVRAEPVPVSNSSGPLTARVATWNTLYSNSTARVVAGLEALTRVSDVIGAQELFSADRRAVVATALAKKGWASSTGADSAVPIFYNATRYKLLAHDVVKEFDVERVESGPSGTSIGPRWIQWVQLQDRHTGAGFFVVNHHIIPGIARGGQSRGDAPKRLTIRDKQVATATSIITKLRSYGPVALTVDSNVDNRADQQVKDPRLDYTQMHRLRMATNWTMLGMPRSGSLIDKVAVTLENTRILGQSRLSAWGSDHQPLVVTIANRVHSGTDQSVPSSSPDVTSTRLPTTITVPGLTLNAEQIKVAATAIRVGHELGVPQRGWVVAIAAALQESGLRNLDYGDRDSVGPWQMRPSTGWGTIAQIRNLTLAARAFYGLADHTHNPGLTDITGWERLTIAQAAQAVERSAFPHAYAKWETAAQAIVAKLAAAAGTTPSTGDNCRPSAADGELPGDCPATGLPAEHGLTPDALLVLRCVKQQFPTITSIGGVRPDPIPDHPTGRAVDLMIPAYRSASGKGFGWTVAAWLRTHHRQLGIKYVTFDNKIWNIDRDGEGWRVYRADGHGDDSALHHNHVHVTVFGTQGTSGAGDNTGRRTWHPPLGQPFSIGCRFGCYTGHTGQDYPAPPGTPVYAVTAGTVIRSASITTTGTCTTLPICGGTKRSYGNLVVIRLAGDGDITAWYAHLTQRRVRAGDTVRAGQVIGTVGYQGNVRPPGPNGSHLHLEIRRGGTPINPLPYLRTKGIQS